MTWETLMTGMALTVCPALWLLISWLVARNCPKEEYVQNGPELVRVRFTRRKKILLFTAIPLAFVAVVWLFLGVVLGSTLGNITPVRVEDYRGDDWVAETEEYHAGSYSYSGGGGPARIAYSDFSGAKTLWKIQGDGSETSIQYEMAVDWGQADLALVHPDGSVTRLSQMSSPYTFVPAEGTTRLRLIGDGGDIRFRLAFREKGNRWVK